MIDWWRERSQREQWMLAGLGAVLAVLVAWYGIITPLYAAREAAQLRHAQVLDQEARVGRQLAELEALRRAAPAAGPRRPLQLVLNETAQASGLQIARLEADPGGGFRVAVESAPSLTLFPWIVQLQRDHGVAASQMTVLKSENGLTLDATFTRPRS